MLSFNFFSIFLFLIIVIAVVELYNYFVDIRFHVLDFFMILVLILVSFYVILNSINYLSIMDYYLFLFYIILFQFYMNNFTLSYDFILIFLFWDLIGLISYLLINFWSYKTYCGIKAVIYNKCGDCFFLLILSFSFINYLTNLEFNLFIAFFSIIFNFDILFIEWFSLSFLFIYFSKSAQFPFSSWLLNAMSAPTPISALLHSSTMVLAGVYLGLIVDILNFLFFIFDFFFLLILILPLITLLFSLSYVFLLNDIKSIIACSTISQISYIFLAQLINSLFSILYFIIHAIYKSLLFLLSGSLIHIQLNFQSLDKIKLNNSLIKILFIVGIIILIFSFLKEDIINSAFSIFNSTFIYILGFLYGMLTTIYSLKIYIYCFYLSYYGIIYSSFIIPMLTITSILIDKFLDSCFSLSLALDFGELFSFSDLILHFSIIHTLLFSILFSFWYAALPLMLLQIYLFLSSELSYFTFQLGFLIFSIFFGSAPIHSLELFTCSSCYCLYHIHYLTSKFQLLLLLFIFLLCKNRFWLIQLDQTKIAAHLQLILTIF